MKKKAPKKKVPTKKVAKKRGRKKAECKLVGTAHDRRMKFARLLVLEEVPPWKGHPVGRLLRLFLSESKVQALRRVVRR